MGEKLTPEQLQEMALNKTGDERFANAVRAIAEKLNEVYAMLADIVKPTIVTDCSRVQYNKLIDVLAYAAKNQVYGPLDRLAKPIDEIYVKEAIYAAIRYAAEQNYKFDIVGLYEEINCFIQTFRDEPSVALDTALRALAKGVEVQSKS